MLDDSQGITLYSLGGVFISTGVGLVIAMVVLVAEVMYYRKQDKPKIKSMKSTVGNFIRVSPTKNFSSNTHY